MKKYFFLLILFLITSHFVCAQDGRVPDQNFIKQHQIKTITAKLSTNPETEMLRDVWAFDKNGNIITHQLFDEADTVLHIERYYYNNQILSEKHVVAHMNFNVNKPDSVITKYEYSEQNKLLSETSKGFKVDRMIQYNYVNGVLEKKTYFDNGKQIKTDSLTYFSNNKIFQVYHSKTSSLTSYTYIVSGLKETELEYTIGDTNAIFNFAKYYYKGTQLVKEIEGFSWNGKVENLTDEEYQYSYDDKQFLKEIKRIRKNVVINTEKYYYTFW